MADEEIKKAVDKAASDVLAAREAKKPRQLEVDQYDQLFIDNILWREKAAKAAQELASRDLADVAKMRADLILKLRTKHQLEPEWQVVIDQVRKTATAERK